MNKRYLPIFVVGLFAVIITMFFITKNNSAKAFESLQKASSEQIENLRFYKDPIRSDGGGLDLLITDKADIENLIAAFKKMSPSSRSLKGLSSERVYRIRFSLKGETGSVLTLNIYKCKELAGKGFIIMDQGESFVTPGGNYESEELLRFAEDYEKKPGFEKIGGAY